MIKKLTVGIAAALLTFAAFADTFSLFTPADGLLVGDQNTYITTSATSSDVTVLWSGTCDSSTFLRGDGSCQPEAGTGTVTSVGLTMPTGFSVSGSPITGAGSFGVTTTLNGVLLGNGSGFTTAASSNIIGLWTGTCNNTTFLRADGSCQVVAGGVTGLANPTGTIGLTAVNGAATTAMRSDGAPALSQSIAPTWTGVHTFDNSNISINVTGASTGTGADYPLRIVAAGGAAARNLAIFAHTGITNGAQFTSNGSNVNLTLNGGTITANGSGLTNIPDGALSSNVALKNATNAFTAAQSILGTGQIFTIGSTTAANAYSSWLYNNAAIGYIGNGSSVAAGAATTDMAIGGAAGRALAFGSNDTLRGSISSAGNWTINAPVSGNTVLVNALNNTAGILIRGTAASPYLELDSTGSRFAIQAQNSASGLRIYDLLNSVERFSINNSGNVVINTPASGTTLALTGVVPASASGRALGVSVTGGDARIGVSNFTTGNAQVNLDTSGAQNWAIINQRSDGALAFSAAQDTSLTRMSIASAGNVTINAPSSGTALTLNGSTSIPLLNGVSASGQNALISLTQTGVGTWQIFNAASSAALGFSDGTNNNFRLFPNGGATLGAPTGGDQGAGTLNTAGQIYTNGVPVGLSGTYTPTLTNVSNVAASTAFVTQYTRTGNVVTVSGRVDIQPGSAGGIILGISLPIASNFNQNYQAGGTAVSDQSAIDNYAAIKSDATNDRLSLQGYENSTGSQIPYFFTVSYLVQ